MSHGTCINVWCWVLSINLRIYSILRRCIGTHVHVFIVSWLTRNNVHRRRCCFGNITLDQLWPTAQNMTCMAPLDTQFSSGIGVNSWEYSESLYPVHTPTTEPHNFLLHTTKNSRKDAQKLSLLLQKNLWSLTVLLDVPRWWAWIERLLHMLYLSWSKQHLADGTHEFTIDACHWELGMDGMVFQFYLHFHGWSVWKIYIF